MFARVTNHSRHTHRLVPFYDRQGFFVFLQDLSDPCVESERERERKVEKPREMGEGE